MRLAGPESDVLAAFVVTAAAACLVALGAARPVLGTDTTGAQGVAEGLAYAEPGPLPAGWRQVRVDPERGAAFSALVYYPAPVAGEGAPVSAEGAPHPAIAFGHGFLQEPTRYRGTLAHLASWGFVVIATESQAGLATDHAQFAADLSASLSFLEQAAGDGASPFHDRVRTEGFGASGHSMGGGASVLAAADDGRIAALANLAAAETRPSAVQAMRSVAAPVHLIVGSEDAIVPPSSTRRMYDAARAPRLLTTIVGGSHCGFQSDPFPIGCDRGSLPADEQLALTNHLLTAFFRLYLADADDWETVWGPSADSDPRLQRLADPGPTPTATPTPPVSSTPTTSAGATASPTATSVPSVAPPTAPVETPGTVAYLPSLARDSGGR